MNGRRKLEICTETYTTTALFTTNPTRNVLGHKPGLRGEQLFGCELDALRKMLWGANCCSDMTERTRYVSYGPTTAALSHLHQAAKT